MKLFAQYDVIVDGTDNFPHPLPEQRRGLFRKKTARLWQPVSVRGAGLSLRSGGRRPLLPLSLSLHARARHRAQLRRSRRPSVRSAGWWAVGRQLEALKLITGVGEPMRGRLQIIEHTGGPGCARSDSNRTRSVPLCGQHPTVTTIEARNYEWNCAAEPAPSSSMSGSASSAQRGEVTVAEAAGEMAAGRDPARCPGDLRGGHRQGCGQSRHPDAARFLNAWASSQKTPGFSVCVTTAPAVSASLSFFRVPASRMSPMSEVASTNGLANSIPACAGINRPKDPSAQSRHRRLPRSGAALR